jgi:hypothetical protein
VLENFVQVDGQAALVGHLRVGKAASNAGTRDKTIVEHSRYHDIRTTRGYVRHVKHVGESSAKLVGL